MAKQTKEQRKTHIANLKNAAELVSEDAVKAFLATTNKKYSNLNCQMILSQMGSATVVAGFNDWKKAGRVVSKGQKGLAIFAPLVKKGEALSDLVSTTDDVFGFRVVYVFDISQTEELATVVKIFNVEETDTHRVLSLA